MPPPKTSRERVASSTPVPQKEGGVETEKKQTLKFLAANSRLNIWPEWDDASLANEKWDVPAKGKSDRAARTPGSLFEDPEGLVQLPASLKIETWRRPNDYLGEKHLSSAFPNARKNTFALSNATVGSIMPPSATLASVAAPSPQFRTAHHSKQAQTVVEDPEQTGRLDILIPNQGIFRRSELIRAIITQISLLYQTEVPCAPGLRTDGNGGSDPWKPWHHLYPRSKPPGSFPIHSSSGKYAVKLFWMGCWRKIVVDDQIPFDAEGVSLLPQCENEAELWLPILAKAIIKVASLDFESGYPDREYSEVSVIQMLTGWLPEVINVKDRGEEDIWNLIDSRVPKWSEEPPPSDNTSAQSLASNAPAAIPTTKEPALIFGSYDIHFDGDQPKGVPEIKSRVGGTSFSGLPPPMIWLTETRRTAIPPPKPPAFMAAEPGTDLKPTAALFQLRQQRQQRIKHDLLLKELAATSPKLIHATSAFPNFEDVLGDYIPDGCSSITQACKSVKKKDIEKKDQKKKESAAKGGKKEAAAGDKDKGEKKKEDKKKSTDDKSEKAEKKKEKKKTPDMPQEVPADDNIIEDEAEEEEEANAVSPLISFWIDFSQLFKSFGKLYVFHKSASYTCHRSVSDMRNISPSSMVVPAGGRRTAAGQTGAVSSATHLRGIPAPSPLPASGTIPQHNHSHLQGKAGEIQPPLIICIDSTDTIEMLISFTSLSQWHEAPAILNPTLGPVFTAGNKLGYSATEVVEYNSNSDNDHMIVVPGRLELFNYIWSDTTASIESLKTIETTATKTCRLTLPAGLHTLRLSIGAPYAWHTDFVSNTPFVIADTESFVNHLNKESLRYQAAALRLVKTVSEGVEKFDDPDALSRIIEEIGCADKERDTDKMFPDIKVFFESLFYMIDSTMGDQLTAPQKDAWTSYSTSMIRSYKKGQGDAAHGIFEVDPVPFKKFTEATDEVLIDEKHEKVELGEDEQEAASTIQKHFRGHHVRKRTRAMKKGSKVNQSTKQLLQDSWAKLEGDELQHGIGVLNRTLLLKPELLDQYSFKDDREKSAYYIDYSGAYPDVPTRNWFLLFKEVFTAPQAALISVSVSAGISGLLLRIIDNETGKQIPTICNRPKPYLFTPNKGGYTFLCEGRTYDGPLTGAKYRLRLVGTTPELLVPTRDISATTVETNEVKEYYVPQRHEIMFRYSVHVTSDTPTTVQVSTSKSDVNFRVEVFDEEEVLFKEEGIGHILIPCVTLYQDSDETSSAKGRRTPSKTRAKSGTKSPGRVKTPSAVVLEPDRVPRKKTHNYIIQATVLRNTWDNNTSPWQNILEQILPKDIDADRPLSGSIAEEKPLTPNKRRGAKDAVNPKAAAKPGGKAASPAFDESKPFWMLRLCSDGGEEVILKKDTQREDEIKCIKAAWEELQPGRAAKAKALRDKYLARKADEAAKCEEASGKTGKEIEEPSEETVEDDNEPTKDPSQVVDRETGDASVSEIRPDSPKFYEIPPAFQPYVRNADIDPDIFDEAEHARLLDSHRCKMEDFHDERKNVLDGRKDSRTRRNELKEKLLATAENMQMEVDVKREEVLTLREALRQKQLAEEAARQAAIEPDHASVASPKPASAKKPKSPKGAKKKK